VKKHFGYNKKRSMKHSPPQNDRKYHTGSEEKVGLVIHPEGLACCSGGFKTFS